MDAAKGQVSDGASPFKDLATKDQEEHSKNPAGDSDLIILSGKIHDQVSDSVSPSTNIVIKDQKGRLENPAVDNALTYHEDESCKPISDGASPPSPDLTVKDRKHSESHAVNGELIDTNVKKNVKKTIHPESVSKGISHWLNIDKEIEDDMTRSINKARIVDPKSIKTGRRVSDGNWIDANKIDKGKLFDLSTRIDDVRKIKTCEQVSSGVSLWQNFDEHHDAKSAIVKARVVDPSKIKIDKRVSQGVDYWKEYAHSHLYTQNRNPFVDWDEAELEARRLNPDYDADNYGWPEEGTLTWQRGQKAGRHIGNEIIDLCKIIAETGEKQEDGTYKITFGKIFKTYINISDKVVGMLWRARKHRLLDFPREMLYQGQDEDVKITLFRVPEDGEKLELIYWKRKKEC